MYIPLRIIPLECIDNWLRDTTKLEIKPGPGGSSMTEDAPTRRWFRGSGLEMLVAEPWIWITVVALYPSSQIVAHRDPPAVGTVRYHIPLQTNDDCWCFHDGVWQQLLVGQVYSMNPREQHGAVNWGSEVRLHLMVDRVEEEV